MKQSVSDLKFLAFKSLCDQVSKETRQAMFEELLASCTDLKELKHAQYIVDYFIEILPSRRAYQEWNTETLPWLRTQKHIYTPDLERLKFVKIQGNECHWIFESKEDYSNYRLYVRTGSVYVTVHCRSCHLYKTKDNSLCLDKCGDFPEDVLNVAKCLLEATTAK